MKRFLVILATALAVFLGNTAVALAYTQEIAEAHPHYIHPVTGVIEDPGNNPGIGQGMTENVLHPQALFEEVDGRYFVTVRFHLGQYISDESFAVQRKGENDFYAVAATLTQSTDESKDFRVEVPGKDIVMRSTFFVGPMGRAVIFYYDFTNFTPGNTDFIPMTDASSSGQTTGENPASSIQEQTPQTPVTPAAPNPSGVGTSTEAPLGQKIETVAVNSKLSAGDLGYHHGLLMKGSNTLASVYGTEMKDAQDTGEIEENAPMGEVTKAFLYVGLAMVCLVTLLLFLASLGVVGALRFLERSNDALREDMYEN